MQMPHPAFTLCLALALAGCVSESVRTVDLTPPKQLSKVHDEALLLDVGVAVLDPNIPETFDEQIEQLVNPDIRRAEAQYMPYFAKNLLQSTGNWGAVRVVPRATHAVDVTVTGKILQSDGELLIQEFTVTDARGTVWFTKTYRTRGQQVRLLAHGAAGHRPLSSQLQAVGGRHAGLSRILG